MDSNLMKHDDECKILIRDLMNSHRKLEGIKCDLDLMKIKHDLDLMQIRLDERQHRIDQVQSALRIPPPENVAEITETLDHEQQTGRGWLAGIWFALLRRYKS